MTCDHYNLLTVTKLLVLADDQSVEVSEVRNVRRGPIIFTFVVSNKFRRNVVVYIMHEITTTLAFANVREALSGVYTYRCNCSWVQSQLFEHRLA